MNRCRISRKFLSEVVAGMKTKPKTRKVRLFLKKWPLELKQGKVYYNNRKIIPLEDTEKLMKREAAQNGMPLSRDGAYHYLKRKYVGFKKRNINKWLKTIEQLQLIHKRPHTENRTNRTDREGTKNYFMKGNRLNLGVDLFAMPKPQWSKYPFFFVAVLQRNSYTWAIPLPNKEAKSCLSKLKTVFRECKELFGQEPTGVTTDDGGEFKAEFDAWLARKRIIRRVTTGAKGRGQMAWWVEKRNSTFGRIFAVMFSMHRFKKALRLTLEKLNNIVSRKTRKAPADWKPEDFTKSQKRYNRKIPRRAKQRKQPVYEVDDRVRYMLKAAQEKEKFYKSYEGMRSNKHAMWSKRVWKIAERKKAGHEFMYKVNGIWRWPFELQEIQGTVIRLEANIAPPAKKKQPPPKPRVQEARKRKVVARRRRVAFEAPPVLRRSTRVRKKPVRYGQ